MAEKNSLLYKAKQHKAFDEKDEVKNRFIIKDKYGVWRRMSFSRNKV